MTVAPLTGNLDKPSTTTLALPGLYTSSKLYSVSWRIQRCTRRVVLLPTCVVQKIRQQFPVNESEEYVLASVKHLMHMNYWQIKNYTLTLFYLLSRLKIELLCIKLD